MRHNARLDQEIQQAHSEHRCIIARSHNDRCMMNRRVQVGEFVHLLPNVYAQTSYWETLKSPEQAAHIVRALTILHPEYVFACSSAACINDELQCSYQLFTNQTIYIASNHESRIYNNPRYQWKIQYIYMNHIPIAHINRYRVTSIDRTLFDCAIRFHFMYTLALFDAAVRHHNTLDTVELFRCRSAQEMSKVHKLMRYKDGKSENGGESFVRAVIIDLGFIIPILQYCFENPNNPQFPLRADFIWFLPSGRIVVVEFDGIEKYGVERNAIRKFVYKEKQRDEILRKYHHVDVIIHASFEDIIDSQRLYALLSQAGIPLRHQQ